jgi:hypothetical protein
MTGAIVFVPGTTFPPFMPTPTPTAPPGPTTQPGPGTQPTGPSPAVPLNTEGLLTLTRPSDRSAAGAIENPNAGLRVAVAKERLEIAEKRSKAAFRDYFSDQETWTVGPYSGQRYARRGSRIVRVTPEIEKALKSGDEAAARAAIEAAPDDPEGWQRRERIMREYRDAEKALNAAQLEAFRAKFLSSTLPDEGGLDDAARVIGDMMTPQSAPSADGSGDTRPFVEQSDAERAPTFAPPDDPGKVDDVM